MLERSIYLTDEADSSQKPGSGKPFSINAARRQKWLLAGKVRPRRRAVWPPPINQIETSWQMLMHKLGITGTNIKRLLRFPTR